MKVKLRQLFCRHRYDYRTSFQSLDGQMVYIYVCIKCGKVKRTKKPLN